MKPKEDAPAADAGSVEIQEVIETEPKEKAETAKAIVKSYDPEISTNGSRDRLPSEISFQYQWTISPNDDVSKDTVLSIKPKVEGKLVWSKGDQLVFVPGKKEFAYNTKYTASLKSVKTVDGIKKAPDSKKWTINFTTPPFKLTRMELVRTYFERRQADFVLAFTGPVFLASLKSRTSASIDNSPLMLTFSKLNDYEVLVSVKGSQIVPGAKVDIRVGANVTAANNEGKLEKATIDNFALNIPGYITINYPQIKEGESGHYIDIYCNDDQQNRRRVGHWNFDRCPVNTDELSDYISVSGIKGLSFSKIRNGFRVHGDIKYGSRQLIIRSGLTTSTGSMLTKTFEKAISIPRRSPKVRFVSQGRYLPRSALNKMPIKHINVDQVELEIRKIHRQNVTYWLSAPNEIADERISDVVGSRKFSLSGQLDLETTSWIDISKLLPKDTDGVFQLTLQNGNKRDVARVVMTDLAIVAKRYGKEGENIKVWVMNHESFKAEAQAEVKLITTSNREVASCLTNGAGECDFKDAVDKLYKTKPFAILVEKGNDLTFLEFADLMVPLGDDNVQGKPYQMKAAYQAAIYSDRGVYRPGETAHISALVRDQNQEGIANLPLVAKVFDPRAKMIKQLKAKTNTVGLVSFDIEFQSFAPTGHYNFQLETGGNKISAYKFNVEEFMPERMKVKVSALQKDYLISDQVEVEIEARYLFGSKASGEDVELTCSLQPSKFKPKQNFEYSYGPWSGDTRQAISLGKVNGRLDKQGQIKIKCPQPVDAVSANGPSKVIAQAAVFEAGSGRTTTNSTTVAVHPDRFYVGMSSKTSQTTSGKPVNVNGVVVNWQGKLNKNIKQIDLELYRLQSAYNYEYVSGRYRWQRVVRKMREDNKSVKVKNGKFSYSFTPQGYSEGYLVRASIGNSVSDLHIQSQGYHYWQPHTAGTDNTPRPEQPTSMEIDTPKSIVVGQKAKVTFKPPFAGKLLFTVETDKIVEARWLDLKMQETEVEFQLDEFAPNVYVSGLLIKDPHLESKKAFIPGRAFGVQSITVEPQQHKLEVGLKVPPEVRPNSKLVIDLDVKGGSGPMYATVAAIDEGILQLTRFRSPDVIAQLFARRALGVNTFETIGWTLLLPPIGGGKSPGGDDGSDQQDAAGRIAPVKPVALWSGIVEVKNGRARVSFDVPTYRGQLRVMAVVAGKSRAGSAADKVTVRDPLVLQATLPRFLLAGDRFVVPVFLTNMTGKKGTFTVKLDVGSGIDLDDNETKTITLNTEQAGTVVFSASAWESFGAADFKVTASGNKITSHDQVTIPFLPNAPLTRESHMLELVNGKNDILPTLAGWKPQTEQTSIWVTSNPYGKQFGHLKYLIRYPYG
jgi:uncharacterized protein YfaS (alpha-2-macroglobulin family)